MNTITLLPGPRAVTLKPVPFGTRDPRLGKIVCQAITDATPPLQLRFNPLVFKLVRRALHGVRSVRW